MAQPTEAQKELFEAKKNYVSSVRWLKETVGYKALLSGSEWENDNRRLVEDAELAFEEAKENVLFWRARLNAAKNKIDEQNKKEKQDNAKQR